MTAAIMRSLVTAILVFSLLSGSLSFAQPSEDLAAGEALFANCAMRQSETS
jgi:hypothetical protein